ncbi:elongation of very long chain fatty acids protein [Thraustotheca clavata]|uniref:Elongation of fatty acids protein n=1 Tax=Thraustotheca clavata TaxID=74557 RepID=A0A1W0A5I0_9STRA|nr:elongation of very long chain fatty acids protein [Thraustotheca clavata]
MRVPYLHEVFPSLSLLYPFSFENDFVLSWQPEFCAESMQYAVALCALYCILCYSGRHIMANRSPFDLKWALAGWNLLLATFSFCGAVRTAPFLIHSIYERGLYHSICSEATDHYGNGPVGLWVALFIFSKVPELIDTFFIVVRKKPLIFLHWYHHITVLMFCWHAFAVRSASGLYFVAMNYSVHAIMYFYYFLTAIGYRPQWALMVTIVQLSQMVVGVAVCTMSVLYIRQGDACYVDHSNLKWGILMYSSYFILFLKFFIERYCFPQKRTPTKKKTQ